MWRISEVKGDDCMTDKKEVTTTIVMDNGEKIKLKYTPSDLLHLITDKDEKPFDKFISFGMTLINPKHISFLYWDE